MELVHRLHAEHHRMWSQQLAAASPSVEHPSPVPPRLRTLGPYDRRPEVQLWGSTIRHLKEYRTEYKDEYSEPQVRNCSLTADLRGLEASALHGMPSTLPSRKGACWILHYFISQRESRTAQSRPCRGIALQPSLPTSPLQFCIPPIRIPILGVPLFRYIRRFLLCVPRWQKSRPGWGPCRSSTAPCTTLPPASHLGIHLLPPTAKQVSPMSIVSRAEQPRGAMMRALLPGQQFMAPGALNDTALADLSYTPCICRCSAGRDHDPWDWHHQHAEGFDTISARADMGSLAGSSRQ